MQLIAIDERVDRRKTGGRNTKSQGKIIETFWTFGTQKIIWFACKIRVTSNLSEKDHFGRTICTAIWRQKEKQIEISFICHPNCKLCINYMSSSNGKSSGINLNHYLNKNKNNNFISLTHCAWCALESGSNFGYWSNFIKLSENQATPRCMHFSFNFWRGGKQIKTIFDSLKTHIYLYAT